jgi:hypothetical protein
MWPVGLRWRSGIDTERNDRGLSDLPGRSERALQPGDFGPQRLRGGGTLLCFARRGRGMAALSCTPFGKVPDRIDFGRQIRTVCSVVGLIEVPGFECCPEAGSKPSEAVR